MGVLSTGAFRSAVSRLTQAGLSRFRVTIAGLETPLPFTGAPPGIGVDDNDRAVPDGAGAFCLFCISCFV